MLVVDDEARNRALMRAYLDALYEVREAPDGDSALSVIESAPVDIVLLDVMMPGKSGYEVCKTIKSQQREGYLPVLLVSALHEQEDRNLGLQAGADDFLTKPADRRELMLRVAAFVRLREQERTIRAQVAQIREIQSFKDDLLSLIVHDLRNPLAGLMGYLQILEAEIKEPVLREDVQSALESAHRLNSALEDILEVRRIEEGRLVLVREPMLLGDLARAATSSLTGTARVQQVQILYDLVDGTRVNLDRKLARRAIENLVANALKYSSAGEAVTVAGRLRDGGVEIEVVDHGPGVPDELKGALFHKFGAVEARRSQKRRSFGLGLYLVKLVAEAHGGTASVHDRQGGGSVFRIFLAGALSPPDDPQR